ncbi:MAG: tetratricopeptide repeat protein [Gemmatimonadales bacterium]|nr:tetratricopeptide repeat protein [Gemmatimonadales bacterium]
MPEARDPIPESLLPALRALVEAGRFGEALERHRRASGETWARRPEAELLAATAAMRLGDLDAAEQLVRGALRQFALRADADGRMRAENLLGALLFERGELDGADHAFGEALRLARMLGDAQMQARASNNVASVAHLRGEPERALGLYREALQGYQRLGDRRGTAETWHNLGLSFRQLAAWHEAESATVESLRHAELVGEGSLLALAVMGRAELELERGHLEVAERTLDRAATLAEQSGDEIGTVEVLRLRALLALRLGDHARAAATAEHGRHVADTMGAALVAAECTAVEALARQRMQETARAEALRDAALAGFARLGAVGLTSRLLQDWAMPRAE